MNERIQELAKQAGAQGIVNRDFIDIEKFAELIIKECIDTLEFHGFEDATDYVKWMATNKLGQHFGVDR